jgi:glycerol uptake facilitator-like aquaporin
MDQGPKSYWAEFLGTFTLCFAGQGAIVMQQAAGTNSLLVIAVAHGLALAVMISALGAWSGAHFNPAVTLGFWITRRISLTSAITYWVSARPCTSACPCWPRACPWDRASCSSS